MGIPAFTGTLAGGLAGGEKFSTALKNAAIVGGATFVTAGLIEGSYAEGWQNKFHFNDARVSEINEIKAQYALNTKESLARAHYLERVVAEKGISASTARSLGWPAPKTTVWDKLFKWEGKGEASTQGWKWEFSGLVETDEFLTARGFLGRATAKWQNTLTFNQWGEYALSTGTEVRAWRYVGQGFTTNHADTLGSTVIYKYPAEVSPWE